MSWSYDPNLSEPKDKVRFLIGDTNESDPWLEDEEIEAMLDIYSGDIYLAAAACADSLAARFAMRPDETMGELTSDARAKADYFKRLARELRLRAPKTITAGGLSLSDKRQAEQDMDRVKPYFKRGLHDASGSGRRDTR